jgi:hypothetical protein
MATTTPNFGWPVPTSTDLVKDGATAIEGLGDAIDASLLDLKGGTTNQVLAKNSNTDMDFKWVSDATGMTNPMTTTGDTIYSSSGSTPARLGIGSTGQVLTVSGGLPTWATPAAGGGGKVLQVVSATTATEASSSSTSYADTNLTATITPTASTSKILVLVSQNGCYKDSGNAGNSLRIKLLRGSTDLVLFADGLGYTGVADGNIVSASANYLDNPATTSATTYKTQFANFSASSLVKVQNSMTGGSTCFSTITLMEIGA